MFKIVIFLVFTFTAVGGKFVFSFSKKRESVIVLILKIVLQSLFHYPVSINPRLKIGASQITNGETWTNERISQDILNCIFSRIDFVNI